MNVYQDVVFRAFDRVRGRRTIERLRFLRQSQHWQPERLRQWQLERLNLLLEQARTASPFHRERLRELALPLRSLDQLDQLPILTKAQIKANFDAIKATNLGRTRYVLSRTGGSTGEPMFYFWDKAGMDWNRASVYRSAEWAGTALGERALQMSGSHFDFHQGQKLLNKVVYALQRYRDCSVAAATEQQLEQYYGLLRRFRPTAIWGYASGVDQFARHIDERRGGAEFPFLRAILTSSETLRPEQRSRINRVFGADKVFDNYGSREMYIGAECSAHAGYHLHAEVLLVEIVDAAGRTCSPGERGRVVLTDLSNHAFPFIRYEIGDLAVMGAPEVCPCGVRLPRLQSLEGRIADIVVLRDRVLTPPNFATLFSDKPGIRAYQIVQDSIDELKVIMEPDEDFSETTRDYIARSIEEMVAGQARVRIITDEPIHVPESGKRRFVVSSVGQR